MWSSGSARSIAKGSDPSQAVHAGSAAPGEYAGRCNAVPDAPTRDKPYYIFVGSVVCLIGLLAAGFSVRWFINAIRPKRKATIDDGTAGE